MTLDQINKFCGITDPRQWIRRPHIEGDYIVASNGHIAIRVPISKALADAVLPVDEAKTISFSTVIQNACDQGNELIPIPDFPQAEPCLQCSGSGKAWECTSCDGNGEFDHDGYDYSCKPCDGTGQVSERFGYDGDEEACKECGGTGANKFQSVAVGNTNYSRHYLALIDSLSNAKIAPAGNGTGYWTADGCDGAIMPTRV